MRRREFIATAGALAVWPGLSWAQRANDQMARIIYLGTTSPATLDPRQLEQFRRGLAENGLIEGRNITIEYLWAEGRLDRLQAMADDAFPSTSARPRVAGEWSLQVVAAP
jgi:hypothetical protein